MHLSMMNRIRNNHIRITIIGLALVCGFFFSGLGFCLNHGYFCKELEQHLITTGVDRFHSHDHHKHSHNECSDHSESRKHIHRKGEPALSEKEQQIQNKMPAVTSIESAGGIDTLVTAPCNDSAGAFSYSTLFSIRSVVMLA
jgi:hypothetical protein